MNKYLAIGISWLISLTVTAYFVNDYTVAKADQERLEAVNFAIEIERIKQVEVNKIEKQLYSELQTVNDSLNIDLEQLRKRADRLPEASTVQCAGSTGKELSEPDAGFLTRFGADTERFRLGLIACQNYAKSLQNN